MKSIYRLTALGLCVLVIPWAALACSAVLAGPAAMQLPIASLIGSDANESTGKKNSLPSAIDNAAFAPGPDAKAAAPFAAVVSIAQSPMRSEPALAAPVIDGRDATLFPALTLELFSDGEVLVPVQRGIMLRETPSRNSTAAPASYWRVIPQVGRTWREPADGEWSRAALPLMLVNDTENHAHQGVATFLYRGDRVTAMRFQFTQQTAPYLLRQHNVFSGIAPLERLPVTLKDIETQRTLWRRELADRLPAKPWVDLERQFPSGTFAGFGAPLVARWQVINALVYRGTLYYQPSTTPHGPFPYPLEMRFGVRSVMKSVAAPLAMLRLAQTYGPYVLDLRIGDYVPGLDPKFKRIRFIDAANMASGFGGTGSFRTQPNDPYDGYLDADYDAWYMAGPTTAKLELITRNLKPYPWEPGTVMRYRDQDYFLLGVGLDAFLKSIRGPSADLWDMLTAEVFGPIGIHHAPAVRTRETPDRDGLVWANAGYYPSLDDLAKIALLVQNAGLHDGKQILHRRLTQELLAAKGALSPAGEAIEGSPAKELYRSGFWFPRYVSHGGTAHYLPSMQGSGENRVTLYPSGVITLQIGKAAQLPVGEKALSDDVDATHRIVDRMIPF